jgi:hypothetical protein
MRRSDQHHALDRVGAPAQPCKRLGRHGARIDIARVRRNQRFRRDAGGCFDRADEFGHARLQAAWVAGIEQARRRRRSHLCALRIRFHRCLAAVRFPDIEYNTARKPGLA